jgi:RNA polymerase sigma-70 factor (ECF subfamily)
MSRSTEDIQKIIIRAKNGDQTAYRMLLNTYWKDIFRFLSAKCENEYDVEDLTIKTFSKAFDKLHQYNARFRFKNWLLTIAHNLYVDFYRSQHKQITQVSLHREKDEHIAEPEPGIEDELIRQQNLDELLFYIKQLKPHYREVIHLRYFREYSYKEIADEMNESVNNIKVRLLRARKLLSEMIRTK